MPPGNPFSDMQCPPRAGCFPARLGFLHAFPCAYGLFCLKSTTAAATFEINKDGGETTPLGVAVAAA